MSIYFEKLILALYSVIILVNLITCFVPAKIITTVIEGANLQFNLDFGQVGTTYPHEEIIRRGAYRSVVKYFHEQPNGSSLINITKMDNEYLDIYSLYYDYYNVTFCSLPFDDLMVYTLQPFVAIVDFDPSTKDMPFAHFDAETFSQSNDRVISFLTSINVFLSAKDYVTARKLSGQILHTIQDFYSHSNWVEMGMTNMNTEIGTSNFSTIPIIDKNESNPCTANCTLTKMGCGTLVTLLVKFIQLLGLGKTIQCPVQYYRCSGNIVKLDELVSGYYSDQKLEDGTSVNKPTNIGKCSHGGILDKTTIVPATGK